MEPCIKRLLHKRTILDFLFGTYGVSTAHYFEPRYNHYTCDAIASETYVQDVCRYCGAAVERKP